MTPTRIDPASFKDPAGFVFKQDGLYYRHVQPGYATDYDLMMGSGLYKLLVKKGWLIPHEEVTHLPANGAYKILLPQQLAFTSYAYEWSFDMLQDAALVTLKINETAIRHGMILKDATPYNIQFHQGKPVFIDTLSFEKYDTSKPWIAYRQFCEMFLFPLYLENYLQSGLIRLLSIYPDGIPATETARLLPAKSMWNMGTWMHVHLQKAARHSTAKPRQAAAFNAGKLSRLLEHLVGNVAALPGRQHLPSGWSNYYDETILSKEYLDGKVQVFKNLLSQCLYRTALDLGANDGYFSRILADDAALVIAVDFDATCINRLYETLRAEKAKNLLPLIIDLSNPSPAFGFDNSERPSFINRLAVDLVVALALVHHLCITKHIPFGKLAAFFNRFAPQLIIEFIPDTDPKVQQIMGDRQAIFTWYTQEAFEESFLDYFSISASIPISGSSRTLYLMKRK